MTVPPNPIINLPIRNSGKFIDMNETNQPINKKPCPNTVAFLRLHLSTIIPPGKAKMAAPMNITVAIRDAVVSDMLNCVEMGTRIGEMIA